MKFIYAVADQAELLQYQSFAEQHGHRLQEFLTELKEVYQVRELPRVTVLTGAETATQFLSDIPLPAYTNEFRTVFCPDLTVWRELYLQQSEAPEIRRYYETGLTENHVLQILGHEFVHHSELFPEEAYGKARWFEEGMCEYLSRRAFLTEEEFREEARINALLAARYVSKNGAQSLEDFCADVYSGSCADIFYFYWASFLTVSSLVTRFGGDAMAVFQGYHRWFRESPDTALSEWFSIRKEKLPCLTIKELP